MLHVVVTAGGTAEPIDDVRVVTNLSSGRFGAALATAFVERKHRVTLVASKALASHPEWFPESVRVVPYGSFAELQAALDGITETVDMCFMAAAVSDYAPVATEGKIRSTHEELVVRMVKNPKLLPTLRAKFGPNCFISGFKLLSGVSRDELVATALKQIGKCSLDLSMANDLAELGNGLHPASFVTPEGGAIRAEGTKLQVAAKLADFALQRHQVTRMDLVLGALDKPVHSTAPLAALLASTQVAGLLPNTSGNVTMRTGDGLLTTPTAVIKADVQEAELVYAEARDNQLLVAGEVRPSVDAPVYAWLFQRVPGLHAIVHFHDEATVLPTATTARPMPCGTLEQAQTILQCLKGAARSGAWDGGSFQLELVQHGHLLGLTETDCQALVAALDGVKRPLFDGPRVVGDGTTVFPHLRGRGIGSRVAHHLAIRGEPGPAGAFWQLRGLPDGEPAPTVPAAASAAVINLLTGKLLLGKRLTGVSIGGWAFPGGKIEPGEVHEEAARRELFEETGVRAEGPADSQLVAFGEGPVRIAVFVFTVLHSQTPHDTRELEAQWLTPEEALAKPLALGMRPVVETLTARMARMETPWA